VNGGVGSAGGPDRGRPDAITAPFRVTVRRPERGWVASLLGGAIMVIARLLALAVVLAGLAGVTAALWWAGLAQIPVVILIYLLIAVAGGGFAAGRSGRLLSRRPRLPEGPRELTWEPGSSQVETGLVWEQDELSLPWAAGQEESQ
jgi:hypothetical protein